MRTVIQRVDQASVTVNGKLISKIGEGLLILLGIESNDTMDDVHWLVSKITQMRIFSDENDKMNLNVKDANGAILIVSQFTLHASTKKGNRPSFMRSASQEKALELYTSFINETNNKIDKEVKSGEFGAMMDVKLVNSGPVTIILDSKNKE